MVTPRTELRRYTANATAATYSTVTPPSMPSDWLMHARESFPSLDAMTLLELEADRDDH